MSAREPSAAIQRHEGVIVVRGWYLRDLRTRAESSAKAECTPRRSCLEPEAHELADFMLGLIDTVEALDARLNRVRNEAPNYIKRLVEGV